MEIRRVQMTGGSSLAITLPKEWARARKIGKNDPVRLIAQPDGNLLITPDLTDETVRRTREFDVSTCSSPTFLYRSLIGTYIAGYTEIAIRSGKRLPPFVRTVVRDFTQTTIGQEVMEETDTTIRIRDLLNPNELSFENTLKRMYVIARSMHEDAIAAVLNRDPGLAGEVIAEDRDVDRLQWLVARQVNMLTRNTALLAGSGQSLAGAISYAIVARIIERIADHAVRIARNALDLAGRPPEPGIDDRIREASALSLGVFDRAVASLFSHDMQLANRTREEVRDADALCEVVNTLVLSVPTGRAVSLGYIVESVRRLGEYSGDIAEMVINDVVERKG
ncbi:MAG: phosphate uptake regulator PhoU [Methanospirillum sp.]|nr:phosphate uptake regulator PhoU [Methanospirillum sp.]